MKQVGSGDVIELAIGGGSAALLAYAFLTAADTWNDGALPSCPPTARRVLA
jgi:hypothetical protein